MEQGKLYAILGPSGCGKTTLLSLLGGLDSPDSGQIYFDGQDIAQTGLSNHRKHHVSFIFQASLNYLLLLVAFIGELAITLSVSRGYTQNNLYQIVKGAE